MEVKRKGLYIENNGESSKNIECANCKSILSIEYKDVYYSHIWEKDDKGSQCRKYTFVIKCSMCNEVIEVVHLWKDSVRGSPYRTPVS